MRLPEMQVLIKPLPTSSVVQPNDFSSYPDPDLTKRRGSDPDSELAPAPVPATGYGFGSGSG